MHIAKKALCIYQSRKIFWLIYAKAAETLRQFKKMATKKRKHNLLLFWRE